MSGDWVLGGRLRVGLGEVVGVCRISVEALDISCGIAVEVILWLARKTGSRVVLEVILGVALYIYSGFTLDIGSRSEVLTNGWVLVLLDIR